MLAPLEGDEKKLKEKVGKEDVELVVLPVVLRLGVAKAGVVALLSVNSDGALVPLLSVNEVLAPSELAGAEPKCEVKLSGEVLTLGADSLDEMPEFVDALPEPIVANPILGEELLEAELNPMLSGAPGLGAEAIDEAVVVPVDVLPQLAEVTGELNVAAEDAKGCELEEPPVVGDAEAEPEAVKPTFMLGMLELSDAIAVSRELYVLRVRVREGPRLVGEASSLRAERRFVDVAVEAIELGKLGEAAVELSALGASPLKLTRSFGGAVA